MKVATVFTNGPSTQAIRVPKEYRLDTKEVWIEKVGNTLIIRPKSESWDDFFSNPLKLSEDFSMERSQEPPQVRDWDSDK